MFGKVKKILHYLLDEWIIRFFVVAKIHLVMKFGGSIREEIEKHKSDTFKKIMDSVPMILLMTTCTSQNRQTFEIFFKLISFIGHLKKRWYT